MCVCLRRILGVFDEPLSGPPHFRLGGVAPAGEVGYVEFIADAARQLREQAHPFRSRLPASHPMRLPLVDGVLVRNGSDDLLRRESQWEMDLTLRVRSSRAGGGGGGSNQSSLRDGHRSR